jgi:SH3-like domain-containing protein
VPCLRTFHRRTLRRRVLALALVGVALMSRAAVGEKGLPVPRFVSLRADEVNLRVGPGEQYPIDWVLTKKGTPVEIVDERGEWRRIRDALGSEGWVHERMVAGTRMALVIGEGSVLHAKADAASPGVARADPGVLARLLECRKEWCRIEAQGFKGWLGRGEIWGVLPDETLP